MEPHGGQWVSVHRAMGSQLYDGTAGIGLYLARLTRVSDDAIIGDDCAAVIIDRPIVNIDDPFDLELAEFLLEREPNLSERARGYLTTIQRAIDDVARTVSRMREF